MNVTSASARVRLAQQELECAQYNLAQSARPWRERARRHRAASIVLGGFASGLALALLPPRWWGRIGAVAASLTATAARSVLTPAFMGAAIAKVGRRSRTEDVQTPV